MWQVKIEGGTCTGSDIVNRSREDCIVIPSTEMYIVIHFMEPLDLVIPSTENCIAIPSAQGCIVIPYQLHCESFYR